MTKDALVCHEHNGEEINLRSSDGYVNATAMCKASGKLWGHYAENARTKAFLSALETSIGIPIDQLVQIISSGRNEGRGTWVHPQVAINLAQWLSPEFAVQVSEWVVNWMLKTAEKQSDDNFNSLSEDEKRIFLRDQVVESNKGLAETASGAGVKSPKEFAIFQSQGYKGMYGANVAGIRVAKGLKKSSQILDHMGSTELAANLFRITQTSDKLVKDKVSTANHANKTHYEIGKRVRQAMLEISGIAPENLPAAPDIKKIQRAHAAFAEVKAEAAVSMEVNIEEDLWKYILLILAQSPNGEMSTTQVIQELPSYISIPEEAEFSNRGGNESKLNKLVANQKSPRDVGTNYIFQGYAEPTSSGFRITDKGREFVVNHFKDRLN